MNNTLSKRQEMLILAATILASGMAFLDGTVVNIAVPSIQRYFHASFDSLLWVVNAFPLVLASFLLMSGSLSDRFGRKKIFASGIALFTLASVFCALSSSIFLLSASRALQGLGAALMIPGSLAIISVTVPPERRGKSIGLWSGLAGGIASIGPFIGGVLTQHFSWHAIFYINVPIGVVAFLLTLFFIPETKNEGSRKLDWWGTVLIVLGLAGLSFGLMSGPRLGWSSVAVIASLFVGILAIILFYFVEKKTRKPLMPVSIFQSPSVLGANLVTLFLYFALSGLTFFLVLNLQQVQGMSPTKAGLAMLPGVLIITFLSGIGGKIADSIGPRIPMIVGPLTVALGMVLLILPSAHASYLTHFMPGLVLFGLGMALVIAPLTKTAMDTEPQYAGAASGVNNAVSRTAALLAIAVLGAVASSIFSGNLKERLQQTTLPSSQQQEIMAQSGKMAAIAMPSDIQGSNAVVANESIRQSFIRSYRVVITINALLALIASAVAFVYIRENKQ